MKTDWTIDVEKGAELLFTAILQQEKVSEYTIIFNKSQVLKYIGRGIKFGIELETHRRMSIDEHQEKLTNDPDNE